MILKKYSKKIVNFLVDIYKNICFLQCLVHYMNLILTDNYIFKFELGQFNFINLIL